MSWWVTGERGLKYHIIPHWSEVKQIQILFLIQPYRDSITYLLHCEYHAMENKNRVTHVCDLKFKKKGKITSKELLLKFCLALNK